MKYLQLLLKPFSIGLFITIIFCAISYQYYSDSQKKGFNEILNLIHLKSIDLRLKARGHQPPTDNIALLAIDDKSIAEIGRWPWPRRIFAEALEKTISYGAKSMGVDVIFSENTKHEAKIIYNQIKDELPNTTKQTFKNYVQENDNDYFLAKTYSKHKDQIIMGILSNKITNYDDYRQLCHIWSGQASPNIKFFENENTLIGFIDPSDVSVPSLIKDLYLSTLKDSENKDYICNDFLDPEEDAVLQMISQNWELILDSSEELKQFSTALEFAEYVKKNYKPLKLSIADQWLLNTELITPDKNTNTGHFNAHIDPDGVIRKNKLFFLYSNYLIPSIGLKTYLNAYNYNALVTTKEDPATQFTTKIIDSVKILNNETGNIEYELPITSNGELLINYRGSRMSIPHVSISDVLNNSETIEVQQIDFNNKDKDTLGEVVETSTVNKKDWFKDKILIVGATASAVYDLRVTPFDENLPGPETHLNVIDNLVRKDFFKSYKDEDLNMLFSLFFIGILVSIVISYLGAVSGFFTTIVMLVSVLIVDKYIFFLNGWIITIIFPLFLILFLYLFMTFYKYFTEERSKKELRGTFSKYVSPSIVDEILKDPENLELGGKKQNMTVLFSDIRGFTTISEMLDPKALSELLNSYLTPMTELVFEHKGTLDKYMGDAVMAFFGAPVQYPDHAAHACRCALSHIKKLKELQIEYEKQGLPQIDIGIGINTGEMSVGNMGSETVRSYTVMGDAVNLGSRLEGINKEYGTRIIISEFTYQDVKDNFICREIDWVRVKGKNKPVKIFELIDEGSTSVENTKMLKHFNKGFELYHQKMWTESIEQFNLALNYVPEDVPSKLYIKRCESFIKQPPPEDWDGVYVMTTK